MDNTGIEADIWARYVMKCGCRYGVWMQPCRYQKHTCSFGSMSSEMHCSSARASHSEKLSARLLPWPGFPPLQSERQIVKKEVGNAFVCVKYISTAETVLVAVYNLRTR